MEITVQTSSKPKVKKAPAPACPPPAPVFDELTSSLTWEERLNKMQVAITTGKRGKIAEVRKLVAAAGLVMPPINKSQGFSTMKHMLAYFDGAVVLARFQVPLEEKRRPKANVGPRPPRPPQVVNVGAPPAINVKPQVSDERTTSRRPTPRLTPGPDDDQLSTHEGPVDEGAEVKAESLSRKRSPEGALDGM